MNTIAEYLDRAFRRPMVPYELLLYRTMFVSRRHGA
jgi:hypothetical protein